jgi:PBP1b-binding outer membrane lipoprotein LpoB
MKMFQGSFVLLLLTLALSGCSSCPCKKNTVETSVPEATQVVAATAAPVVAQAPAPVESAEESVPAATRKYVNK